MNARAESLAIDFKKFLDRYTPRRSLQGNPEALEAEIEKLMGALIQSAPTKNYLTWLERVTNQLDRQMTTSAWPLVADLVKVCSNQNKHDSLSQPRSNIVKFDPVKINAQRMNDGEPVGEDWLYGHNALLLEQSGLVDADTMRRYRSTLYFSAKRQWGEGPAGQYESHLVARHQDAKVLTAREPVDPPKGEPFKRMPKSNVDRELV